MWETPAPRRLPRGGAKGGTVSPFHALYGPGISTALSQQGNIEGGIMPLGKRWIGCMLIGIGLMLFGVSHQHWQEWSGFAILAAGIVLVLPERITGRPAN